MANDIIDINVSETVDSVSITVNPNLTTVNINQVTGGLNQTLQSVTDLGSTTSNSITANSFIKSGGTGANVLLDNGSTTPLTSIVGTTNLTYTSGVSNGVVNSNTGTDATIPLADGTNAGLFSATEKTKLSGIASGAEVNVNADWNAVSGDAQILNKPTIPSITGLATTTYVDNKDNSQQLQLNYLDRDNSIFDAFYLRTIADGSTVEASNQLLSSLAVLRNISYVNQGYTQQINADKFVKLGGAADEYLMADGSISTGGGGGGGATNLTTTQTISNFTINSNTGTDATVPLGNGTLAGATLNDYTTAEKNKLSGIATGAEVNVNADWNATSGDAQILNKPTISGTNTGDQNLQSVTNLGASTTTSITANSFVKSGGTSSEILAADGSVITAGNNITITGGTISSVGGTGGGGSSVNYYLNGGTSQGTFGGTTYYEFSKTAVIGTGADFSRGTNGYIASFITDVADPSLLLIPAGNWNLEFFFSSSSAGGSPSFYVELYKYDGTTFTLIASNSTTPEGITGGTAIDAYFTPLAVPETVLTVNDRLAIRVFVNASSKTITLHTQNGHLCEVITTFTAGLTALNGLQAQVQNFATGTTGTDFDIVSSGSTHTFNLPSASATARGVVTTASQTFAGDKTFTGAISASNLSGTNTGDNATNTQYSGLATSKQDTLQNTVNIKSINGNSILGSGDLTISGTGISSLNGLTGATQTFSATTTTGTGIPAWTSSGTNHQLNIPIAGGATTTGLITGTSQAISGSKQFLSNPEIPVPAGNSGSCIVLGTTGGGGATGTLQIGSTTLYPTALEMQYVKGITSSVQTQLDGKQPTLTAGTGINITSNTISAVETSKAAYTMLANNTNASAVPTTQVYKDIAEQTYSGTITWSTTAPTTILSNTYKWNQIGSLVTVRLSLSYSVAGSNTQVIISLPTDLPTPSAPTGFTGASDILYYGTGSLTTTTSLIAATSRVVLLRRNAANNGYEFVITIGAAVSIRVAHLTLQYFT